MIKSTLGVIITTAISIVVAILLFRFLSSVVGFGIRLGIVALILAATLYIIMKSGVLSSNSNNNTNNNQNNNKNY